ncbi:RidA family protein [Paenarthrobacter ilicis]|uniref:RidA family protein n=1 Tax=Paenarthrobacter ilicis TaxID=43665 RepID=UPI0028D0267A|nr:RidA family protein [Paenarthrobacter ilicis]
MTTKNYDTANRPYRGSVAVNDLVFLSGRLGMRDGALPEGVPEQTLQAVRNVENELANHGLTLNDIIKVTVYLDSMADYETMNHAYLELMPAPLPARTCIAVEALPYGGLVELDVIASRQGE